jgi:glycosyltransferase involved in cell wall biosynthesis
MRGTVRRRGAHTRPARRRIAFLVWRDVHHPLGGGSELFVERVARHLAGAGWDVTICTSAYPGAAPDEFVDGVRIRRRGGRLTVYLHGLLYLLTRRGRSTDVVVDVQNGLPFCTPLVRRRGIVNLVHHVHREQWHIIFSGWSAHLGWWIESWLAPRLYRRHAYVTVSEATRDDLVTLGVEATRISIVHNGLDDHAPEPRDERAAAPTICVLGRLVPHKQIEHALDAAAALRPTVPDLHVDVVGEGWWHAELEAHAERLGITDAVTFHGRVADAERDRLLDRAWVQLTPSVKEGWGIAIMEGAAHGVPAIAYASAGGVRESIVDGETGWLVADQDELVKRTEELLADPALRTAMSANARRHAAGFDWAGTGRRFQEVLAGWGFGPTGS